MVITNKYVVRHQELKSTGEKKKFEEFIRLQDSVLEQCGGLLCFHRGTPPMLDGHRDFYPFGRKSCRLFSEACSHPL